MAIVTSEEQRAGGPDGGPRAIGESTATAGTTLELVARISFGELNVVGVELANTGATAFNACEVRIRPHPAAGLYVLANTALEFADDTLIGCVTPGGVTADPTTLAGGSSAMLQIRRNGADSVEIWASVASGSTTAACRWRL